MNKKGFTIIEILIVIILISVLLVSFSGIFQLKSKSTLYGQVCVNNLYGDISNFFFAGITSKAIYSGSQKIFPSIYYIDFDVPNNQIILKYLNNDTINTNRILELSGNIGVSYYCLTNSYKIILSGSSTTVKINKGLSQDENLQTLTLSGGASNFLGEVDFLLCENNNPSCKDIGKFQIDTRIQNIKKKICLVLNDTGSCQERDN